MLSWRSILLSLALSVLILAISSDEISRVGEVAPVEPSVTFVAVGDVLLNRGIARRIGKYGLKWPFEKVAPVTRSADLAFCNLECPLSVRGVKINKPYCFKADPATVKCLTNAGFDIVSLANNHAMDCSRTGLVETMHFLDKFGIAYTGAGDTLAASEQPTILRVKGLRIAFLARNKLFPEGVWFRPDAPNIAPLDPDTISTQVADAARQADVVVVSLHWGVEYRKHPQAEQVALGRRLIDAGADLVIGHHSHRIQRVEKYHGGVIAYSLGNFLFDSPSPVCAESIILRCRVSRSGVSDLEIIPIRVTDCRPCPTTSPGTGRADGVSLTMVAGRGQSP